MVYSSTLSAQDFLIVTLSNDLYHKKYIARLLNDPKKFNAVKIEDSGPYSELSWMDYIRNDDETKKLHTLGLKSYISMQNGSLVHSQLADLQEMYSSGIMEVVKKSTKTVTPFEKNDFFGSPVAVIKFRVPDDYDQFNCLSNFFAKYGSADEFTYIDRNITDQNLCRALMYSLLAGKEYIAEICPVHAKAVMSEAWDRLRLLHSFSGGAQCLAFLWPEHSFKFPAGRTLALDSSINTYIDDDKLERIAYIGRTEEHEDVFDLAYKENGFEPGDFILKVTEVLDR